MTDKVCESCGHPQFSGPLPEGFVRTGPDSVPPGFCNGLCGPRGPAGPSGEEPEFSEPVAIGSRRGKLEMLICGAIKDTVHSHGPITKNNANSAAKRIISVLKVWNRGQRNDGRGGDSAERGE